MVYYAMSNFLTRLQKNSTLISVLIQIEDFLDNLDVYVFDNWFDAEIVDGPNIERYWVTITLAFPLDEMPDPQGAVRIIKHGAKVKYAKAFRKIKDDTVPPSSAANGRPAFVEKEIWLVTIKIPRQFIEELDDDDLELYDSMIDIEDISDARDENIDTNTQFADTGDGSADQEQDEEEQ